MSTILEGSSPGLSGNASVEAGAMTFVDVQLPSGRHGLPPEFVEAHQRQRLLRAICNLCAKSGYGSTTIAHIAREVALKAPDLLGAGLLIGQDHLAQVFRIKLFSERGGDH